MLGKSKENVMSFVAFCSFLSYALIAAVTPGPNNILALSSAAAHGLRRSVPLLAGISAGFLAVMLLCGGAALVLARVLPGLAAWLVWPGAFYILWLAWRMAAGGAGEEGESGVAGRPLGFWSGLALQFVNVKVLLCGLTALTSFVLPHAPDGPHVLGCALVFAALGVVCNLLWAGAGGLLRETFRRHGRALNLLLAGLLAASVLQMFM